MTEAQVFDEAPRVFIVTNEEKERHRRLDLWLVEKLPDLSRSTIKRLFDDDNITTVNGSPLSMGKMPAAGTEIEVEIPPPVSTELVAQDIPLNVLFEDESLIVIVKPQGLCVHPAPGHPDGTLVNAILGRCPDLKGIGGEKRPGIVHRLDLGTSGIMVVAKSQAAHEGLVQLFSKHDIERVYEAVLWGVPNTLSGKIETMIARHPQNRQKMSCQVTKGKTAITYFEVLHTRDRLTHARFKLETGRTHQIRVHASQFLRTPIVCDPLYSDVATQLKHGPPELGFLKSFPYQLLHAKVLGFVHPVTGATVRFEIPPTSPIKDVMDWISEGKT